MMAVHEVEVWVCVDVDGNATAGEDQDIAQERYEENVGPLNACGGYRLVHLTVKVPMPVVDELTVKVPELPGCSAEAK